MNVYRMVLMTKWVFKYCLPSTVGSGCCGFVFRSAGVANVVVYCLLRVVPISCCSPWGSFLECPFGAFWEPQNSPIAMCDCLIVAVICFVLFRHFCVVWLFLVVGECLGSWPLGVRNRLVLEASAILLQ